MHSIFHFWKFIVQNKTPLSQINILDQFKYDEGMLSCSNRGIFPDLAIRLNKDRSLFTGGELIELKDSKSYVVSSFNSTIPTGKKNIRKIIPPSEHGTTYVQMTRAGDNVLSLEEREVYYLVRGRKGSHQKICLVHGSFFETLDTKELIRQSFGLVLDEKLAGTTVSEEVKEQLSEIFSEQTDFSRVRSVSKASVKLRFRILTEVKTEGNILNPKQYPEIVDDSLNFIVPYHSEEERAEVLEKMRVVVGKTGIKKFKIFSLKHPLNGWFVVFQTELS